MAYKPVVIFIALVSLGHYCLHVRCALKESPLSCETQNEEDLVLQKPGRESQISTMKLAVKELFGNYSMIAQSSLKRLLKRLGIGRVYLSRIGQRLPRAIEDNDKREKNRTESKDSETDHKHKHNNGRLHELTIRKESSDKFYTTDSHGKHMQSHFRQCLERRHLLRLYGLPVNKCLSTRDFLLICPAIVEQISSGVCTHDHPVEVREMGHDEEFSYKTDYEVWGYGVLAITVISLTSLCVIAAVPFIGRRYYHTIMSYLVALAIGTLSGDALLHLIPHSLVGDDDHDHKSSNGEEDVSHNAKVWRACFVLLGMYLFFLIDQLMKWKSMLKKKGESRSIKDHFKRLRRKRISSKRGSIFKKASISSVGKSVALKLAEAEDSDEGPRYSRLTAKGAMNKNGDNPVTNGNSRCAPEHEETTEGSGTVIEAREAYSSPHSYDNSADDSDHIVTSESTVSLTKFTDRKSESPAGADAHNAERRESAVRKSADESGPYNSDSGSANAAFVDVEVGSNGVNAGTDVHAEKRKESLKLRDDKQRSLSHSHGHDHGHSHGHGHGHGSFSKSSSIASVAWMVIVGDGFHNFSDGLAVGAAFAASMSSGIGTGIAVLCHELPHELGDFAVLLQAGMTVKQAIAYNLMSAFLSYVGLVVGIMIGNNSTGREFVLAFTAGLFLYISLATMLPQLKAQTDLDMSYSCLQFGCQQCGMLTGIGIMLVISIYEKQF